MAPTISFTNPRHTFMTFREASLSAPDATTPVLLTLYPGSGMAQMGVGITETGNVVNLDAFAVEYKFHEDGAWISVAAAAGDYTTPTHPVVGASGDLTTLVKNTSGWLVLNIVGVWGVRFSASGNIGISVLTIEGSAE